MNNIEILEEYIKEVWKPKPIHNVIPDWATIGKEQIEAIENLIQENNHLKEHLQKYYNGELYTAKQLKNIEENQRKYFIHKSKVKEIIYPTPENYIPLEVQTSEMYKKLKKIVEGE